MKRTALFAMNRDVQKLILTAIAIAFSLSTPADAQSASRQALSVKFSAHEVTVSGLAPGGRAIVFASGLEPSGKYSVMFNWSAVADDTDRKGSITFDVGRAIPGPTIWCVADANTGALIVTGPGLEGVPLHSLPPRALHRHDAHISQLAFDHALLDLLYVEPGRGAWIGSDQDGSRTEDDGPNGITTVSLQYLKPLWGSPTLPGEFRPGGILVAIDPIRLEVETVRLDAAFLGAVQ